MSNMRASDRCIIFNNFHSKTCLSGCLYTKKICLVQKKCMQEANLTGSVRRLRLINNYFDPKNTSK